VWLFSILLAGVVVNLFLETPNVVGGRGAMMVGLILLAVVFRATIMFFLTRWQKRRDEKRHDKPVA
jgi:hypothetical protein